MTKSYKKAARRRQIEWHHYNKKETEEQDGAREAGLCQRCEFGLLCLVGTRLAAKKEAFRARMDARGCHADTATRYVDKRMLCKQEEE